MSTLLLRLAGPMQSWGVQSHFIYRDTLPEPSKSGVVGLLCAALGRDRSEEIRDVAELKMGIRVDREGLIQRDYHTAGKGGYLKASGQVERKDLIVSYRDYLADAAFLVGLEGNPALLAQLHDALHQPKWLLCLGRKAFVPGESVWLRDGLRMNESLIDALRSFPRLREPRDDSGDRLRAVVSGQRLAFRLLANPTSRVTLGEGDTKRKRRKPLLDWHAQEAWVGPQPPA